MPALTIVAATGKGSQKRTKGSPPERKPT